MKTIEIGERKWNQFCDRIEESCRGALVTIEIDTGAGPKTIVAEGMPLRHVALDNKSDPCNTQIIIEAGSPEEKPIRHIVLEPIHIRLNSGNGGDRYNTLQIFAENGTTTVEIRPGLNPALLKGLEIS